MKIKITLFGLLLSIMSYSQETPTSYQVKPSSPDKKNIVVDQNKVYSEVEQAAEFPGGMDSFRNKFASSFDSSQIKAVGEVSTNISFIIEKDGSFTHLKAEGNNAQFNTEAIRAIKSIKNKWAPAKMNGEVVRSRFNLPLKMFFDK